MAAPALKDHNMTEQQHDESKLERVIRKIKRCLALSKSSNENEAATAMRQLVPRGEEAPAISEHSTGRDLMAVEAQDQALIEQFLSGRKIGKTRKTREVELDLNAHIAGLLAGKRVELNPGMTHPGQAVLRIRSSTDHI